MIVFIFEWQIDLTGVHEQCEYRKHAINFCNIDSRFKHNLVIADEELPFVFAWKSKIMFCFFHTSAFICSGIKCKCIYTIF